MHLLFHAHNLSFYTFKYLIEEQRCCITFAIDNLIILLLLAKSAFQILDSILQLLIQLIQTLAVLVRLLTNSDHFIKEDLILFFDLHFINVVFRQFALKEVTHLGQFGLTLVLQRPNEIGHFHILLFGCF